ncbi:MAG: SsrA-binding protein SmpB [Candidatus Limnocylindria bacterium]
MATARARPPSGAHTPAAPEAPAAEDIRVLADNRRAFFDYHIERKIEAGIALRGTEIKSVRAGRANLREGYARVEKGEAWLRNVHIAPWTHAARDNHEPTRPRKLLLHRAEIGTLAGEVSQKGVTLVPLRLYVKRGVAKVELGVARGKKRYDKRQTIRERETAREMDAAIRRRVGRG